MTSVGDIDHDRDHNAVIVVDDEGYFLGNWRATDVEGVRQVIIALGNCIRWFENSLHLNLISLFAKEKLHFRQISKCVETAFSDKD